MSPSLFSLFSWIPGWQARVLGGGWAGSQAGRDPLRPPPGCVGRERDLRPSRASPVLSGGSESWQHLFGAQGWVGVGASLVLDPSSDLHRGGPGVGLSQVLVEALCPVGFMAPRYCLQVGF